MTIQLTPMATIALLLAGALLLPASVGAASATATSSATIISPTEVDDIPAAELLKSASTGVLTLSIPGAGASGTGDGAVVEGVTLTSTGVVGNTIVFSIADAASLATLGSALASSGGSFDTNGILSTGQGVHLVVTRVVQGGNGKGTVYAIIAYN
ncbi:MAG: hypothetical protein WA003_11055 [Desulfuromonadaceae bacterium]